MVDTQFLDNEARSRFEYHRDGGVTYANYRRQDGALYIDYVEAPVSLRGTGAAGELMEYIVDQANQEELTIIPVCTYVAAWLRRHTRE